MRGSSRRIGDKNQIIFKIILIGESGTGKSCLMNRYVKKQFASLYQTTIGTQFQSKTISVDDNHSVKLQIWDTAGQESFRSIIKAFFRNAAAVLLVYNITNRNTLKALNQWKELTKESAPQTALFILVGTHLDEEQNREVTREQANQWMIANKIDIFFETSAKSDVNVTTTFEEITKRLFCNYLQKRASQTDSTSRMKLHEEEPKKQNFCC